MSGWSEARSTYQSWTDYCQMLDEFVKSELEAR